MTIEGLEVLFVAVYRVVMSLRFGQSYEILNHS